MKRLATSLAALLLTALSLAAATLRDEARELRDQKVAHFVRRLPTGRSTLTYRLRAEVPGQFSALPAKASAMYAPELRGNSAEVRLRVTE